MPDNRHTRGCVLGDIDSECPCERAVLPACPRCGDPGYEDTLGRRFCGNPGCDHTDELPSSGDEDRTWLAELEAAGEAGLPMPMGRTGATKRLAEAGLVRWEQTSPFVARVWKIVENNDGRAA